MAGSLRSIASRSARKKKRGESEEDYAKRIIRLEQKRESQAKNRKTKGSLTDNHDEKVNPVVPEVAVRVLHQHNSELEKAEAQIAALVKTLNDERQKTARLQAKIANIESVASVRKDVESASRVAASSFSAQGADIIDLSHNGGQFIGDHEIIRVFDVGGHTQKTVSSIEPKLPILQELSADLRHRQSDPASPPSSPLKGVSVGRGRATHRVDSGIDDDGEKIEDDRSESISLAEASEMLLWVGWVERARREIINQPLYVRFGLREQRAWRDAVSGAAEFVRCSDIDEVCETIPFAFELAWTLRYALDSLPAASPVLDVCWRFMSGFMKPQPRARLGILSGAETVSAVKKKFEQVHQEVHLGTLIIDRGSQS